MESMIESKDTNWGAKKGNNINGEILFPKLGEEKMQIVYCNFDQQIQFNCINSNEIKNTFTIKGIFLSDKGLMMEYFAKEKLYFTEIDNCFICMQDKLKTEGSFLSIDTVGGYFQFEVALTNNLGECFLKGYKSQHLSYKTITSGLVNKLLEIRSEYIVIIS